MLHGGIFVVYLWVPGLHGSPHMFPMKATNKSMNIGGVDFVRLDNGKAVERWGYFDTKAMMMQLGLMPPPPPMPEKKM